MEANGVNTVPLGELQTAGGHTDDRTQPLFSVVHHRFANPAPLELLSSATGNYSILENGCFEASSRESRYLFDLHV